MDKIPGWGSRGGRRGNMREQRNSLRK